MTLFFRREPAQLRFEQFHGLDVIAIDGDQGAGKTTDLAKQFHKALGGEVIDMDSYLELSYDARPYLEKLDLDKARQDIISSASVPKIIVGVLLLDMLEKLEIKQDLLVFAKLIDDGVWSYQHYIGQRARIPKSSLTREIAEYYNRKKPWEHANFTTTLFRYIERC